MSRSPRAAAYLDVEIVTRAVLDVTAVAGPGVIHRWPSDAIVDDDAVEGRPLRSSRSSGFRTELMDDVSRWYDAIRASRWRPLLAVHGIDLLEVARYEWFYAVASPVHRLEVLRTLTAEHGATRIVWVAGPGRVDARWQQAATAALRTMGVELEVVELAPSASHRPVPGPPRPRHRRRLARGIRILRPARRGRRRSPDVSTRVLFVEEYGNAARVLVPPAAVLDATPGVETQLVAAWPSVVKDLGAGHPVDVLIDVVGPAARIEAHARARAVRWAARSAVSSVLWPELQSWGALAPLARDALGDAAALTWSRAASTTVLVDAHVAAFAPDVTATSTFTGSAVRAAAYATRRRTGAAALVQHGRLLLEPWRVHHATDAFVMWGERDRRELEAAGFRPDRIVATGSPHMDALSARSEEDFSDGTGDAGRRRRVTYVASLTGGRYVSAATARAMRDAVLRATAAIGADLVIKAHPDDTSGIFTGCEAADHVTLRHLGDTIELMRGADIVVVSTSTAGLEACALDRPVVVLTTADVELSPEYAEYGAALFAADGPELLACFEDIARDGERTRSLAAGRRRLVADLFAGAEPGADRRIACALLALAGDVHPTDPGRTPQRPIAIATPTIP